MRYQIGEFQLDTGSETVSGPQGAIGLRPQTWAVLRLLVERAPALVTHETILAQVWGHTAISDSAVAQTIKELRQAFGDSARAPRYIETRPRRGYRLLADVRALDPAHPDDGPLAAAHPRPLATAVPVARRARWPIALVALLALGAVAAAALLVLPRATLPQRLAPPEDPAAQRAFAQGRAALASLDAAAALAALERARQAAPVHAGIALALAEAYELSGDVAAAQALLDTLAAAADRLPLAERLRLQAAAARLAFHWDEAAAALASLHALDAQAQTAWALLEAQIAAGRTEAAARTLQRLRDADASQARTALAAAQLAHARQEYGAQREAASMAADWAARDGADALAGRARLLVALAGLRLGELQRAHEDAVRALASTRAASDARGEGDALLLLASVALERAELELAESQATEALQAFSRARHRGGEAEAERTLGLIADRRGDSAAALAALRRSAALLESLGDRAGVARVQAALGAALVRAGQVEPALAALDRAREAYVAVRDRRGQAGVWNNQGMLLARSGRREQAQSAFERALEAFEDIADRRGQAVALGNLAALASQDGQVRRALELNHRALAIFTAIGAQADATRLAYNLGLAEHRRGDLEQAHALLARAAEGFAELGTADYEVAAWTALGDLQLRMGRNPDAAASLARASALEVADPLRQASVFTLQGRIARGQRRHDAARTAFERARTLRQQAQATVWVHASELDLAGLSLDQGRRVECEQRARRLAAAFGQAGEHTDQAAALHLLAESLLAQDRRQDAAAALADAREALSRGADAQLELRVALLQAQLAEGTLAAERLDWVERTAREQGFVPLAIEARSLRQRGSVTASP